MFKEFLKSKGISEEDFAKKTPQEMAELHSEFSLKQINKLQDEMSKSAKQEDIDKAIAKFQDEQKEVVESLVASKDFDSMKSEVEKLREELKEVNKEMVQISQKGKSEKPLTLKQAVIEALTEEKFNEIKDHVQKKSKGGWVEVPVMKVVGNITTANATQTGVPSNYGATVADSFNPYTYGATFLEQYLTVGSTDNPHIPYVNETAGEGDAAIVAEGGLKPLIDADYVVKYSTAEKVAGRMKASEESLYDYKWLSSAMEGKLKLKHDRARQADVLSKVIAAATTFNAALLSGVTEQALNGSNKYDQIAAVVATIAVESNGAYIPNLALVNTIDALNMKLTKDGDGNYIMPPFSTSDGNVIEGLRIAAHPEITAGSFVIGDLRNINLENVWDYVVKIGWEDDDFSKNLVTMIGESRYHVYISDNDKRGIVTGTFANVADALEADV